MIFPIKALKGKMGSIYQVEATQEVCAYCMYPFICNDMIIIRMHLQQLWKLSLHTFVCLLFQFSKPHFHLSGSELLLFPFFFSRTVAHFRQAGDSPLLKNVQSINHLVRSHLSWLTLPVKSVQNRAVTNQINQPQMVPQYTQIHPD